MANTRRRFGSIRRLSSGRWQARYLGPDGRPYAAPGTFASKTDAGRSLSGVETDILRGSWLAADRAGIKLASYARAWIAERRVKGRPLATRTRETYLPSLDTWIEPYLGDAALGKITPAVVRTWHAEISSKVGPTATRQAYALLRAVLSTAVVDGALPRNPCMITGAGQASSPERPLLDIAQVERIAAAMPEHLRALVLVAFWVHLRLGELLGLERGDLDLDAGTLLVDRQVIETDDGPVVTAPKAASRRTVHLPQPAVEALRDQAASTPLAMPTARVFTRRDGSELRAHHVHGGWKTARRKAGLPNAHLHDLRHAGLTLAAQSGATLAEVMRRAGHVSSRAAMIYQHAAERRDAEVAARLSALAKPGDSGTRLARVDHLTIGDTP